MNEQVKVEPHSRLLRVWHLAILRFALTHDNADRLGVLAIANEIDRLGGHQDTGPDFSFFRRTSTELCAAMLQRQAGDEVVLKRYLAAIDDPRLNHTMAAAVEVPQPKPDLAKRRVRPDHDLWRGLPSRARSLRR